MGKTESAKQLVDFEKGLRLLHKGKYEEAQVVFVNLRKQADIDKVFANRVETYSRICQLKLAPPPPEPKTLPDLLTKIVFHLNRDEVDLAQHYLEKARKLADKSDLVHYIESIFCCKAGDTDRAIKALTQAVELDSVNRIRACNDADFEPLYQLEEFTKLVES